MGNIEVRKFVEPAKREALMIKKANITINLTTGSQITWNLQWRQKGPQGNLWLQLSLSLIQRPSFAVTILRKQRATATIEPQTFTYPSGTILKETEVPESFNDLLRNDLVANNAALLGHPRRLQKLLITAFLNSWQQNVLSYGWGKRKTSSPFYLYGGFGISHTNPNNAYHKWPRGYLTDRGAYHIAIKYYPWNFYRGGATLKLVDGQKIAGIAPGSLKVDVRQVDLMQVGTYPVVYTYTNPQNLAETAQLTVPVKVGTTVFPFIAFPKESKLICNQGEKEDYRTFKAVGNWQALNKSNGDYQRLVHGAGLASRKDGSFAVNVFGQVNFQKPGIYPITYQAQNCFGLTTKLVRYFQVIATEKQVKAPKPLVGYINCHPGYWIVVLNAKGQWLYQYLPYGSAWQIYGQMQNRQGQVFYRLANGYWLKAQVLTFKD